MQRAEQGSSPLKLVGLASRGLDSAWRRGLLTEPPIDPEALVAKAERREGEALALGDWEKALAVLTRALRDEAALNPLGLAMAHGQLVGILRQRIRAARLWREEPRILDPAIDRPVVILGQMRSGTTFLHRLLACDPAFTFTRHHESLWPLARTRPSAKATALAVRAMLFASNPALRRVHPTAPDAPEEEFGLHAFSLHGAMFDAQWRVPSFTAFDEQRDLAGVYREFGDLLRTLRWRRGDPDDAIQLLKAPQFMADLPALRAAFPDARFVRLRRDERQVAASSASLVCHQRRIQSDSVDSHAVGQEWLDKIRRREARAEAALADVPSSQLHRVAYEQFVADWRPTIAAIYDFLGLSISAHVWSRMEAVARSRSHEGHDYSPEHFGLAT